jgi:hypothetical protein
MVFVLFKITVRDFWCYRLIHKFVKTRRVFIKTQRGKRQLSTGNAAALIGGLRQVYFCKAK